MADQTIPNTGGDVIKNVEPDSWSKGECPPEWGYNLLANTPLNADTEMGDFN